MMTEMDLLVKSLEEFGLENFIKAHRFNLCNGTINQSQVAGFLEFDTDHIAIINCPPDNYSRSGRLYELMEKTAEPRKFLEALVPTGNGSVLEIIRSILMEPAASSSSQNLANKINLPTGIWFNIPEPIDSFCGREDFLKMLHEKLQLGDDSRSTPEVTVLSQVKIVSGLGGIGKTQTVRRYIMKYLQFYNNFIWINAETENSMTNSFIKLANELTITVKNPDGKYRKIAEIIKEIYNNFCEGGKSNLIVFDNAEDYQSCKNLFPFGLHPDLKKPVILATSRNQEWKSATGKIGVLPLDVLTDDESLEFILTQLEIEDSPEFREESREFIQLIGGLPLALQQAVAYIKQQKKDNRLLGLPYKIDDYVDELKSSAKKLQNFSLSPGCSATVFITWNVTFEKIQREPRGKIAIDVIQVMSLFYADKIPVEFLLQLLPLRHNWSTWFWNLFAHGMDFKSADLVEGLNILEKFSMIKIDSTGKFVSVHRQIQFVLIENLKNSDKLVKLFDHMVEKCLVILENIKLSESDDIFLNVHQIVKNQFDFIPVTQKYLDFMYKFGHVLWEASRYGESLNMYQKVHSESRQLLGPNHQKTLEAQHEIALQLLELGRYEELLTLHRETLQQMEIHPKFGVDHPMTIDTKQNIAEVLRHQKKYEEALKLRRQVLAQRKKIYGENDPLTLSTQMGIASLLSDLGSFPKALVLYQDLEEKQTEILGPDHKDVLTTKHNKASVLLRMCKLEEASEIFNEVYEKNKEILGENHLNTISTLRWIATTLEEQGKSEEALELYKKVYEIRKTNLGENHPKTINVKTNVVNVESRK